MPSPDDPLPDPEACARACTDQELEDYRRIFGERSREWMIAERELKRRGRRPPSFMGVLLRVLLAWAALIGLYFLLR